MKGILAVWKLTLTEGWGTGQYHLIILTLFTLLFFIDACKPKSDVIAGIEKRNQDEWSIFGPVTKQSVTCEVVCVLTTGMCLRCERQRSLWWFWPRCSPASYTLDQGRFSSAGGWTRRPPPLTGCRCSASRFDTALTLKHSQDSWQAYKCSSL